MPDPYDTDAHKAYLANLAQQGAVTQQGLAAIAQFLTTQQQASAQAKIETDIKSAVDTVKAAGFEHPNAKVIEALLDAEARSDVRFKKVWENRDKNPTAWNNACKAVASKFQKDFDVKVDPDLVAAQRARKASQNAMATTTAESADDKWDGMKDEDFSHNWQQLIQGGNN